MLVTDAMTDITLAAHEHTIDVIFPLLGETGTVAELVELLNARTVP